MNRLFLRSCVLHHWNRNIGHCEVSASAFANLIDSHTRRHFTQHQAFVYHIKYRQFSDDTIHAAFACQWKGAAPKNFVASILRARKRYKSENKCITDKIYDEICGLV